MGKTLAAKSEKHNIGNVLVCDRLDIKMSSYYQYRDSHVKDKTVFILRREGDDRLTPSRWLQMD